MNNYVENIKMAQMMMMMMMTWTRISLHTVKFTVPGGNTWSLTEFRNWMQTWKCRLSAYFWLNLSFVLFDRLYLCVDLFKYSHIRNRLAMWPGEWKAPRPSPLPGFSVCKNPSKKFHFHFSGNFLALSLCRELRLRAGMFNDHMPWGYQVNSFKIQETR